jgi:hypothetical protein
MCVYVCMVYTQVRTPKNKVRVLCRMACTSLQWYDTVMLAQICCSPLIPLTHLLLIDSKHTIKPNMPLVNKRRCSLT